MSINTLNEALRTGITNKKPDAQGAAGSNSLDEIMVDDLVNDTRAMNTTHGFFTMFDGATSDPLLSTCNQETVTNCASVAKDDVPVRFDF